MKNSYNDLLRQALEKLDLAKGYAEDGAPLTAAFKANEAVTLLMLMRISREKALGK